MPRKYCKICDEPISRDWIREHFKDQYSKYCSKECKEKDEITIMKDELNLMVRELNTFYHHVNRNNITTTLTYSFDIWLNLRQLKRSMDILMIRK